ncbi:MAG: hypothetical protein NUV51_09610 [Sulfuricaulis sp.]|nr:hypothetical protein [Sulfuricaulis sp.]
MNFKPAARRALIDANAHAPSGGTKNIPETHRGGLLQPRASGAEAPGTALPDHRGLEAELATIAGW